MNDATGFSHNAPINDHSSRYPNRRRFSTVVTEENLRRVTIENKNSDKRTALDTLIEKKVNEYYSSLDSKTRSQLSRTQILKSFEKVCEWKNKNKRNGGGVVALPKEYMLQDIDPALFYGSTGHKQLLRQAPVKSQGNEIEMSSSIETKIDNDVNETEVKRVESVKDWLTKRQVKLDKKDKLTKWMEKFNGSYNKDELIKMWQEKWKEYTIAEWMEIYNMKESSKLTTNELLRLYRLETPAKEKNVEDKYDETKTTNPNPNGAEIKSSQNQDTDKEKEGVTESGEEKNVSAGERDEVPSNIAVHSPSASSARIMPFL